MGFKRKRSVEEEVEEISPTSSTSSGGGRSHSSDDHQHQIMLRASISPSPLPHPTSFLSAIGDHSSSRVFSGQPHSSGMLHSRTRKRWRDNRPDEATIHDNTLHKLFSAQRQQQQHLTSLDSIQMENETLPPPVAPAAAVQKTSLHAFWSLPGAPTSSFTISTNFADSDRAAANTTYENNGDCSVQRTCMDCDAPLTGLSCNGGRTGRSRWDGVFDNDDDEEAFACYVCGKSVCDQCAVVREARVCLDCVMMD